MYSSTDYYYVEYTDSEGEIVVESYEDENEAREAIEQLKSQGFDDAKFSFGQFNMGERR